MYHKYVGTQELIKFNSNLFYFMEEVFFKKNQILKMFTNILYLLKYLIK